MSYSRTLETITLDGARRVKEQALAQAAALGLSIALAIMDRTGILVLAETMDEAPPGASETALMKAKGAARYRMPTHLTAEFVKTLPAQLAQHALSLPDLCAFQGGMPIKVGDRIVGGLGISGGSGEQDIAIAQATAAAVA
jgi:uncharacterized protein GlcG (DUF336 family)